MHSEQNLKSDVRNVNTALGVDVPRTKPEILGLARAGRLEAAGPVGGTLFSVMSVGIAFRTVIVMIPRISANAL